MRTITAYLCAPYIALTGNGFDRIHRVNNTLAGIRELYERGFWEYQELKRLKSKLAGPAYRERMRLRNG